MYSHVAPVYQKTCIKISTPYVRSYLQTKLAKLVFSSTCCPFVSPYRSTGTRFKKLFLSIVFTILKKSYFLNIQPVYLGFVCDLPPGPDVSQTKKNTGSLQRYNYYPPRRVASGARAQPSRHATVFLPTAKSMH